MKRILSDFIKNKSVRTLIVLIFTVEIVFFAMLTGYLSYTSGLHTITESANQISSIVNDEITKMLMNYLEEPCKLEQIHKNMILNHQIDFSNQAQRDKHFVEMLKIFPRVTNTYIGLANGYEYGARREDDGSFIVWNSNIERKTLDYYKYDSQSGRQSYIKSLFQYDTRQRPPFLKGIELEKPGWTDVYSSATGRGLVITAVYPVYAPNSELIGVLGSSLLLNWIDEYLKSLTVTEHSSIFIIGRNEKLIASTDEALIKTKQVGETAALISASESNNPLLVQCVKALKEKASSIDTINEDVALSINYNSENFLLHAHPISERNNLEFISIILIPEKDLTHCMHDFINQLILITVIACILGLITGVLSARYIINPLIKVNQVAKKIAEGDFSAKIAIRRHDEIGQLVHTVNEMSTKLEQARETMLAAQETKVKAEKIFSIGTMAAGISHEINQPLNSIKVISGGILYLLNQGEKLHAEEFSKSIKEISSQSDRITNIIKHLRSFIRRDANQLVPCNINTSVEMALNVVGKQLTAHAVTVRKNLQQNLPPVLAVSTGLEEIVVNLLVNAMQALDTVDKKNKEITMRTYFSTKVILEISDNGPGIDPTLGKTIFESFTSTKLHGENLGLGLAIINNIVTSYLGTVEVTSNDTSGATFTVSLPAVQTGNKENIE